MSRNNAEKGPRVLHISADFPDPIEPFKTPVIKRLVELTAADFDHRVISLNRRSPGPVDFARSLLSRPIGKPSLKTEWVDFDHGEALTYSAPPRGLWHRAMLEQLADRIAADIAASPLRPDLLIAHKLGVEGIAVRRIARQTGIPFALTIQGNTDRKILAARPDLRALFREIFHEAKTVFAFTPNARMAVERYLGERSDPVRLLPCPTDLDTITTPHVTGEGLASVFHLKNYHVKNLSNLARAAKLLQEEGNAPSISIVGGGSEADRAVCQRLVADVPSITLEGAADRDGLPERLNRASGMVMPSRSESFGLVFIEALFCGVPIIYPANTAIDGYFDDCPFAVRVDASSPRKIADAIRRVQKDEAMMKAALAKWQVSDAARRFTRPAIAATFRSGINSALKSTVA